MSIHKGKYLFHHGNYMTHNTAGRKIEKQGRNAIENLHQKKQKKKYLS